MYYFVNILHQFKFQSHKVFLTIIVAIVELFAATILLFASCELCGRISTGFDDINDMVDEFDWYLFPIRMKKALLILMINAQKPVEYRCFGSTVCNRETFKKVSHQKHNILWNLKLIILISYFFIGFQLFILVFYNTSPIWINKSFVTTIYIFFKENRNIIWQNDSSKCYFKLGLRKHNVTAYLGAM